MESILTNSLRRADRFWLLDGAMGTQLQNKLRQRGQDPFGLQPELLNLTHPEIVTEVHREYLLAGANILYTNTFGASRKKLQTSGHTPASLSPPPSRTQGKPLIRSVQRKRTAP